MKSSTELSVPLLFLLWSLAFHLLSTVETYIVLSLLYRYYRNKLCFEFAYSVPVFKDKHVLNVQIKVVIDEYTDVKGVHSFHSEFQICHVLTFEFVCVFRIVRTGKYSFRNVSDHKDTQPERVHIIK
ncbi:hypothetical protein X801_03576 [Opisthorchis viverrini]|nr:hypothetical protein X801_03576 [Opisthorchis viverrini]